MIERYELREELGRSPHALTTLRLDRDTGRLVVVKSLDLAGVDDLKVVEMFQREAKVLRGLDHPGIPRLIDSFDERGESTLRLHLVQEYVEGDNLAVARKRRGGFEEQEVVRIARELLEILRYLHSFSPPVIHRDIKPTNVILAKDGSVRLIDFSGVRDTMKQDRRPEGGFTIVGSYGYMPFEQYEGRALPASDIYAFGMTLIFLLTGLEPIDLDRDGMRVTLPDDARISGRLRAVLERMIEPDVGKRFQSCAEMEEALPVAETRQRNRPRAAAWIGLAASLLVLAGSLAFVASRSRDLPQGSDGTPRNERRAPSAVAPRTDDSSSTGGEREKEAWKSFEPLPPDPDRSTLVAQGLLTYAGQPLETTFTATPKLRIWSEKARGEVPTPMRYSGSAVDVFDLEPGVYSVWASYWDGERSFHGGTEIRVEPGRVVQFEFHMTQRLLIRGFERAERREGACEIVIDSPLAIEWPRLEKDTFYDYVVYESRCDGKGRARPLKSGSTAEPSLNVELPPNEPGSRYQVSISARQRGAWVGNGGAQFVIGRPRDAGAPKVE